MEPEHSSVTMELLYECVHYLTRPIIPLCFGVPLLLPATLLVTVAFLQDHISVTLHVLGILLLSLSVLSITLGIVLGCRNARQDKKANKLPTTKGFQKLNGRTIRGSKSPKNSVTPLSVSGSSSLNNSRRSSPSDECFVVTNEIIRLVPTKYTSSRKNRKTRILLPKKSKARMPSLKEEDHSMENGRDAPGSGRVTERNIAKLEKTLKEIGLGGKGDAHPSPGDVEVNTDRQGGNGVLTKNGAVSAHSRAKSLPEKEFQQLMKRPVARRQSVLSGSVKQEEQLRNSARASREATVLSLTNVPVLTNESHERTGVRSDIGNMGI